VTRTELFALVDFEGACERYPDSEIVVFYNTSFPDFPNGIVGLLVTPKARLRTADGEGRIETLFKHGDVMRIGRRGEFDNLRPRRQAF
jgi:hypothetical protein